MSASGLDGQEGGPATWGLVCVVKYLPRFARSCARAPRSALFPYRAAGGNAFLTSTTDTPTLLSRIAAMVDQAEYFVIMKGTLGEQRRRRRRRMALRWTGTRVNGELTLRFLAASSSPPPSQAP